MKIALLGTGFGQAHAEVYAQRPDIDEVMVYGRSPDKLAAVHERFGFATSTDLDAVISDRSVDLVDVCLPTHLHAETVLRALDAGKHVLTELPMADNLADTQLIIDAAAESDRQVFVDMFERFIPANQAFGRRRPRRPLRAAAAVDRVDGHRAAVAGRLAGLVRVA